VVLAATSTTRPPLGGTSSSGSSPAPGVTKLNCAAKPCRCFFSSETSSTLSVSALEVTAAVAEAVDVAVAVAEAVAVVVVVDVAVPRGPVAVALAVVEAVAPWPLPWSE